MSFTITPYPIYQKASWHYTSWLTVPLLTHICSRLHPKSIINSVIGRMSGGDEENRTPVRKRCHIDFSERSLCLSFRYGQTQTTAGHPILEKFPSQPSRSQASGIPQLAPYPLRRELSEQGLASSC